MTLLMKLKYADSFSLLELLRHIVNLIWLKVD